MSSFQILADGNAQTSTGTTLLRQLRALLPSTVTDESTYELLGALQSTDLLSRCYEHNASSSNAAAPSASSSSSLDATLSRLAAITSSALHAPALASCGSNLAILQLGCDPSTRALEWGTTALSMLLSYGEAASKEDLKADRSVGNAKLAGVTEESVEALLRVAWTVFGEPAKAQSRPEYRRTVVSPNLSRLAAVLTLLIEAAAKGHTFASPALPHLVLNLTLHPPIYRPFTPRLHAALARIVYADSGKTSAQAHSNAVSALVSLHMTGHTSGGGASQGEKASSSAADLWSATIRPPISAATASWHVISSTFAASSDRRQNSAHDLTNAGLPRLPTEPYEALPIALKTLELMLGSAEKSGIISLMLCAATATVVTVPLHDLLDNIILPIISLPPAPEAAPSSDASLQALQTAALPRAQRSALQCLAAVAVTLPRGALTSSKNLARLCDALADLVRNLDTPSTTRVSAGRALALLICSEVENADRAIAGANLAPAIDPADPLLLRVVTAALSRVGQWIAHPEFGSSEQPDPSGANSNSKSARKRRKFESDETTGNLFAGSAAQDGRRSGKLRVLRRDEAATSLACMDVLGALISPLDTELTPEHRKLSHTTTQVIIALGLLSLSAGPSSFVDATSETDANAQIARKVLRHLQHVLTDASSGLLSLALAHIPNLVARALQSPRAEVRVAATQLSQVFETVTNPRLPPRLARAADERPTEWDADAQVEEIRVGNADEVDQSRSALEAMRGVGLRHDPTPQDASSRDTEHEASPRPSQSAHADTGDLATTAFAQPAPTSSTLLRTLSQGPASSRTTSPHSRAMEEKLEPTKPLTRAPTATLGSPSLMGNRRISLSPERLALGHAHANANASASASGQVFGAAAAAMSKGSKGRTDEPGSPLAGEGTSALLLDDQVHVDAMDTATDVMRDPQSPTQRAAKTHEQVAGEGEDADEGDEEDEDALPTLDLRSSDEESDEE